MSAITEDKQNNNNSNITKTMLNGADTMTQSHCVSSFSSFIKSFGLVGSHLVLFCMHHCHLLLLSK